MAKDPANNIECWMEIPLRRKDLLGQIRHWDNLKIATEEAGIWVKDFTDWQVQHPSLQSIPFTCFYYLKDDLLFRKGSLLPSRKAPGLLWTSIETALPVSAGKFNHNFFGINQQLPVRLVPTDIEHPAAAMLVDCRTAHLYITTAPAIRLRHLHWVLVDRTTALILGAPLLPLNGQTFWQRGRFLYPVGYTMEFPILEDTVAQQTAATEEDGIWWISANAYNILDRRLFRPLTIASWRSTVQV